MSRADRLNELRRVHRQRTRQTRTWVSSGEGTDEVAAPLAGPPGRGAQPPVAQALPVGETLTVLGDPQVADGGGTPLVVSRRAPGIRGGGQTDFEMPASRFEPGTFAYYTVTVSFDWQSWTGGGWVAVERSGVELERCQSEFGVRFEHVFHVGVIDPADEEWVEVLASPAGDPTADGFDETPDGQTLTNLRITWELVDVPRVPVDPDEGVRPWAWYRGDDLAGTDGDPVTSWADRTGNGRHLLSGSEPPLFTANAVDGQPGLTDPGGTSSRARLQADYAPVTFGSGFTVAVVMGTDGSTNPEVFRAGRIGVGEVTSLYWMDDYQAWFARVGGYLDWEDAMVPAQVAAVAWAQIGEAGVSYNGGQTLTSQYASMMPTGPADHEWHFVAVQRPAVAEVVVFDQVVDPAVTLVDFGPDGVQTLDAYLAGRYPSLFGGV